MYLKLVLITCVVAFCAIVFSAYARLNDAGLGCENWPTCYEANALKLRQPPSNDTKRSHSSWQWKLQNLTGALLGMLSILVCGMAWKRRGATGISPLLPTVLLSLMFLLGVFGALAFQYLPRPIIVLVHFSGGISILIILTWIFLGLIGQSPVAINRGATSLLTILRIGLALVMFQIMLGGWVSSNFAALACRDFPLCQDSLVPRMDFSYSFVSDGLPLSLEQLTAIHWMHRVTAVATLAYSLWLSWKISELPELKLIAWTTAGLTLLQTMIGILGVRLGLPILTAVLHNALAMLLLVTFTVLYFKTKMVSQEVSQHRS
jgi:cytochrome c oxidase assembly protein subunit 15